MARDGNRGLNKLKEKHLLNMVSSTRMDHRRFLKHMIFDKKVGKYVLKQTSKKKMLNMDIILDVMNYEMVSPEIEGVPPVILQVQHIQCVPPPTLTPHAWATIGVQIEARCQAVCSILTCYSPSSLGKAS